MSNKITSFQLCSLMLINDIFVLFCLGGEISAATAAGFGIGSLIQFLFAIPLICMYKKRGTLNECGKVGEITLLAGTLVHPCPKRKTRRADHGDDDGGKACQGADLREGR